MFLSGGAGEKSYAISHIEVTGEGSVEEECVQLNSNHEEADTRIVLHAIFSANNGAKSIVIHCSDTDVLVLFIPTMKKQT